MLVTNIPLRNSLMGAYLLGVIPYSIYNFTVKHVNSVISKEGHLQWNFFTADIFVWIFWLFFFFFAFVYEGKWFGFLFGVIMLLIVYINYKNDRTIDSMWCWGANSFLLVCMIYLLIVLPFYEKAGLC
jgi:hypothetical protein